MFHFQPNRNIYILYKHCVIIVTKCSIINGGIIMVTISHLVKKAVNENSFLSEAIGKELISHGNLAEQLKPEIERELGKKIKKFSFQGEIIMRTNIMDFNIVKSGNLLSKIKNIYSLVNFEKGDTLNIILGSNEVSIVANEKY